MALRLVRRREVPVPTIAGWLLLAGIAAALGLAAVRGIYPFLAPSAPVGGGVLVVEGWGGAPVFDEAAARFATGRYERIATTGGSLEPDVFVTLASNWADVARIALEKRGVDPARIDAVSTPPSAQNRTFLSAVMLRERLAELGRPPSRLDVVTLGPHARRTRRLYRLAFGDAVEVGVVAAPPHRYAPERWWSTSEGTRTLLTEAIGLAWSWCCFHPGEPGSNREKSGGDWPLAE